MEVRISEKEITAGVVAYLNTRGFALDVNNVQIEYTQGRKEKGLTAVLVEGADAKPSKAEEPVKGPNGKVVGETKNVVAEPANTVDPQAVNTAGDTTTVKVDGEVHPDGDKAGEPVAVGTVAEAAQTAKVAEEPQAGVSLFG